MTANNNNTDPDDDGAAFRAVMIEVTLGLCLALIALHGLLKTLGVQSAWCSP